LGDKSNAKYFVSVKTTEWYWLPSILFLFVMLFLPLIQLVIRAFQEAPFGVYIDRLLSIPLYIHVLKNTIEISFYVATISVFIALLVYLFLIICTEKLRYTIIIIITVTMLISILLRSFAWMILLSREGIATNIAIYLGIIAEEDGLLFTRFSVVVGMVHILLPYAILILWSLKGAESVNLWVLSRRLGAGVFYSLKQVIVPRIFAEMMLSWGVIFVLSIGFYITPELLGGGDGSTMMMGGLISEQVNELGEWGFGSLLSILLVIATILFLIIGWLIQKSLRIIGLAK